jgi:ribose 5-phosphate isomerase B
MKVGIGADAYGYRLKEHIKRYLAENSIDHGDIGVFSPESSEPYYNIAGNMAAKVADGQFERGILICGTGMGMAIIANKTRGIYASVCESIFSAQKSRSINNSNILTMGEFIVAPKMAEEIVDIWLKTEFTQGWSEEMTFWLKNSMNEIKNLEKERFR